MKPKALLLLSLVLAVAVYIAAYTPGHAQAGPSTVRIHEVTDALRDGGGKNSVQVSGRVVGFSCVVGEDRYPSCFVATMD